MSAYQVPGWAILAVTFTNKAAGEMKQRISATTPRAIRDWGRLDQPWPLICTFHSLCLRILKHYATRIETIEQRVSPIEEAPMEALPMAPPAPQNAHGATGYDANWLPDLIQRASGHPGVPAAQNLEAERVAMEEVRRGLVYYDVPPAKPFEEQAAE